MVEVAVVVGLDRVVASSVVVVVVGAVDRELLPSVVEGVGMVEGVGAVVDASVLAVAPPVSVASGVKPVEIAVPFCCRVSRSKLLVPVSDGGKAVVSADEKASRQHARVAKVVAMVLL